MEKIKTKYGIIAVAEEEGKKKCNFKESAFYSTNSFLSFLSDENLTKQIFGY